MLHTYETVVGLEVHIQLNTASKAFSTDKVQFQSSVNENISAVTLALPGTLPYANTKHVEKALKLALALESKINQLNYFDRKNYFYPDLPKGYQITQDRFPIAVGGKINFESEGREVNVRIHHMHMEEDAGKSIHDQHDNFSLIDYNRAGTPLVELVTEPDFRSGQEVHDFMEYIQQLVKYLEISDGNMEEGSMRCDCNVSVRKVGAEHYGERCEIKNVNSKRFARQAIDYEAGRQIGLIENGGLIQKSTLLFDPNTGETRLMRKKEAENDYRYFPEPDLPPIHITDELILDIKGRIDYLPNTLYQALKDTEMNQAQAKTLCQHKWLGMEYLSIIREEKALGKEALDLILNKLISLVDVDTNSLFSIIQKDNFFEFLKMVESRTISKSEAYQQLLPLLLHEKQSLDLKAIASKKGLILSSDNDEIESLINSVLTLFPDKVIEYRKGKKGLIGFFMGQIKQKSNQSIDAILLTKRLEEILNH